jgi:hypothetical protein
MLWKTLTILFILGITNGCYTFRGFSISEDLKTFSVSNFRSAALNAPPTIQQTFSEQLKQKISRESRLTQDSDNPDLTFSGTISRYSITAVSPERGATTASNRLDIGISVTFENNRKTDDQWTQTFSHFLDFPSDQNVLDIQDEVIDEIFDQIIEDIFNKAFSNW